MSASFILPSILRSPAGIEPFRLDFFRRQFPRMKAFLNGRIVPPYEVEVQPSSSCSARCQHCWGQATLSKGALRTDDLLKRGTNMQVVIEKILEAEAEGFKVESVKFVGSSGDPLENPNTLTAIDSLVNNRRGRRMFTNGIGLTYLDLSTGQMYAERLASLNYLRISLDAGSEEAFARIKRRDGKFEDVIKGITTVRRASESQKTGTFIHVGFVISRDNFRDIERAASRVKDAGAHGIQYRRDLTNPSLPDDILAIAKYQLDKARSMSSETFVVTQVDDDPVTRPQKCYYPFFWVTVGSDGCLYPCGHRGFNFGWHLGSLLEPGNSLLHLLAKQRENTRVKKLPDDHCEFCPPVGLHASQLMDELAEKSQQDPAVLQTLESYHEELLSKQPEFKTE